MAARTWLAVILCCVIWFGYIQWFAPPPPPPPAATTSTTTAPANPAIPPAQGATAPKDSLSAAGFDPVVSHNINNGKLVVGFSAQGGKISEVALREYNETIKKDSPSIRPVRKDLAPLELATLFTEPRLKEFGTGVYQAEATETSVKFVRDDKTARVVKQYDFTPDDYYFQTTYNIQIKDASLQDGGYLLIPVGGSALGYDYNQPLNAWEVLAYQNDSLTRTTTDSLEVGEKVTQGNTSWVGFGNRYFSTVLINEASLNPDVVLVNKDGFKGAYLRYPLQFKADQKEIGLKLKTYVGPKDYAQLSKTKGMRELIDYGFFAFLAYPLLELLQFFNRFVHNYGVAILLLTLLVRVAFYPLSVKSARSMKAMQKIQPQIAALKEKYKDDMPRFNQEQMALFKTHNVNPLGGCLPMLIQLPVFFALYAVLGNSIELFHAPFFGWVQDLSSKDPLYIFPILMGISMFVQQKMTPMAGMDPMQQKMMLLMPVVFSFIMINLPSGLTIYIFLSTLLGIVQQSLINREHKGPVPLVVARSDEPSK